MKPHVINAALQVLRAEGWSVSPCADGYTLTRSRSVSLVLSQPDNTNLHMRVRHHDGAHDHWCDHVLALLESVGRLARAGLLSEPAAAPPVETVPATEVGSAWAQRLGLTAEQEREVEAGNGRAFQIMRLRSLVPHLSLRQARDEVYARFYPSEPKYDA